jgi:hypothetical protein
MKAALLLPILFLTNVLIPAHAEPLFNGKDLAGWQGMHGEAKNWTAVAGVLTGTGGEGAQWLATTAEYDDFDLSMEFNVPEDGNSGVFIRAPKDGIPYVDGMEIQLLDDEGEKWKGLQPDQFTGSIYAVVAPSKRVTKPAGEWQTMRILCVGRTCQVWVNGQQVIDANLDHLVETHGEKVPGLKRDRGFIGLQNHGDPVSFRNIDLRAIPTTGWIDLYNGKNLDGWHENKFQHKPEWKIAGGVLIGHGGQGYLSSLEQFDDFELEAEARISDTAGGRGNSGIYFRCAPHTDLTQEFPPGYEAQLDHGDGNNPTGSIYNLSIEGSRAPVSQEKDGEWVTMRIRAVGNHLQTWVNGQPGADCHDSANRHTTGSILLQMHHLTGKAEFRQVRIRRITK